MAKSCIFTFMMLTLCVASSATAAIPSDTLLPPIAKGYLSVPDVDLLRANGKRHSSVSWSMIRSWRRSSKT